jgi:hypothetical protein
VAQLVEDQEAQKAFLCVWDQGLNSGLHMCKAGALPLEPLRQIFEIGSLKLFAQDGFEQQSS